MAQAIYPGAARAARLLLYLILLQVGFTMPLLLPVTRCALTAPFHPYPSPRIKDCRWGAVYFLLHFP